MKASGPLHCFARAGAFIRMTSGSIFNWAGAVGIRCVRSTPDPTRQSAITPPRFPFSLDPSRARQPRNPLRNQGKLDEAIAEYRQAIRLIPDFAEAHNDLGIALKEQGKPDESIAEYRQAIRLKPDLAWAHNNLGNALKEQGKLNEAIAEYREAIRLNLIMPWPITTSAIP